MPLHRYRVHFKNGCGGTLTPIEVDAVNALTAIFLSKEVAASLGIMRFGSDTVYKVEVAVPIPPVAPAFRWESVHEAP